MHANKLINSQNKLSVIYSGTSKEDTVLTGLAMSYLNPSQIGVVTSGEDGQRIPFVNVYLIDTVT